MSIFRKLYFLLVASFADSSCLFVIILSVPLINSRAMYGLDVMIDETGRPRLCIVCFSFSSPSSSSCFSHRLSFSFPSPFSCSSRVLLLVCRAGVMIDVTGRSGLLLYFLFSLLFALFFILFASAHSLTDSSSSSLSCPLLFSCRSTSSPRV